MTHCAKRDGRTRWNWLFQVAAAFVATGAIAGGCGQTQCERCALNPQPDLPASSGGTGATDGGPSGTGGSANDPTGGGGHLPSGGSTASGGSGGSSIGGTGNHVGGTSASGGSGGSGG